MEQWGELPDGSLVETDAGVWIVRMGVVTHEPIEQKKYEDTYVSLRCLISPSNSTVGYKLVVKRNFPLYFHQDTYLSLLSSTKKHKNPVLAYEDQKVRLYRFNTKKDPSYWFLIRYRPKK